MNSKLKPFTLLLALAVAGIARLAAADETISAVIPETPQDAPAKKDGGAARMQGMLEQRLKQLDATLKLTDDQKQKIRDIWAKEAEELKKLSPEERRAKGRDALKATHDQVRAVLTPDQQTKFDQMRPEGARAAGGKKKKAE